MRTKTDWENTYQWILDTFCQAATHFDGATIFWTILDHPDHCAKQDQDLTDVREYLDIFQKKAIELNLNFIDQQNKSQIQKVLECQTWKFWQRL